MCSQQPAADLLGAGVKSLQSLLRQVCQELLVPVLRRAKRAQDACQLQQREALQGPCLQACLR
jgi:hypothetical protein